LQASSDQEWIAPASFAKIEEFTDLELMEMLSIALHFD
jgi:hypothetical protein